MERILTVTGTLGPQEESTLSAKVVGRLQQPHVDVGSRVRPGDIIAQVEPRDYELRLQQSLAALSQARAALGLPLHGDDDGVDIESTSAVEGAKAVLDEATKNLSRFRELSKDGIASQSDFNAVEAGHAVALTRYQTALDEARVLQATVAQRRAEYEIARKLLADSVIRAPFAGTVQARLAGVGEYVAAGTPIVTLVQADPLRLRLDVPERESGSVRVGQPVRVSVEGDTRAYVGTVTRVSPAILEDNRMLRVEADVPSAGSLRPGQFASAAIVVNPRDDALSVPSTALVTFAGLEKVVVVEVGKALEKSVSTGRRGPDWIEIVSGLAAGETVVLDPAGVRTGEPVSAVEEAASEHADGASEPARF